MGPIYAVLLIYLEYAYPQGFGFFSVTFMAYVSMLLYRYIHLTLTLKSLCMISLKGDDEVLVNNRHRTFPATYGSLAIIDLFFVISF